MTNDVENYDKKIAISINTALRIAFVAGLLITSYLILKAFIAPILWGIIIAVTIFPLHKRFSKFLGNKEKLSATIIVIVGILALIIPLVLTASSTIESFQLISDGMSEGTLKIPAPDASVADWPLIGQSIYDIWNLASQNLSAVLTKFEPQLKEYAPAVLGFASGLVGTIFLFIISIAISGVFLTSAEGSEETANKIFKKLAGSAGEEFSLLARDTIRSVVQGVLGTALIQTLFLSIGLYAIGFPAAGVISLVILFVAIIQLPPALIMLPAIIYVFSYANTTPAVIFAIWSILWSLSDSFIKPLLMGRGMDIPMLVILLGAIGGMLMGGIIGLFIGAVALAFSYKIFIAIFNTD